MKNAQRIQTARYALASSLWARGEAPRPADDFTVIDLLTDLRHYCVRHGIDYRQCLTLAEVEFTRQASPVV
ncbi:MAG TPA: hypothetical protein VHC90_22095 [Bryobacteraceae bacterium]|nr:hypothetical protein [Bryobacteraceae bacterium]